MKIIWHKLVPCRPELVCDCGNSQDTGGFVFSGSKLGMSLQCTRCNKESLVPDYEDLVYRPTGEIEEEILEETRDGKV